MKFYLFKKTVFNCRQATFLMIKKSESGLTFTERLKLSYHLLFCDPCKNFLNQSGLIDQLLHNCHEHLTDDPAHSLSPNAKQKIQELIDSES